MFLEISQNFTTQVFTIHNFKTPAQGFFWEFSEIFDNAFLNKTPPVSASVYGGTFFKNG